jgi:hypothetical protein
VFRRPRICISASPSEQSLTAALSDEFRARGAYVEMSRGEGPPSATARKCDAVVVVWSKTSVTMDNVLSDARIGRAMAKLAPIVVSDARIPFGYRQVQGVALEQDHPNPEDIKRCTAKILAFARQTGSAQAVRITQPGGGLAIDPQSFRQISLFRLFLISWLLTAPLQTLLIFLAYDWSKSGTPTGQLLMAEVSALMLVIARLLSGDEEAGKRLTHEPYLTGNFVAIILASLTLYLLFYVGSLTIEDFRSATTDPIGFLQSAISNLITYGTLFAAAVSGLVAISRGAAVAFVRQSPKR